MPRRSAEPAPLLLDRDDPRYPAALATHLAAQAPQAIAARGNLDVLQRPTLALFCSAACPGNLILRTYELMRTVRDRPPALLGGFHTPMERECLDLLLRGTAPLAICPARSVEGMRVPARWQDALDAGRLALLSPFSGGQRRVTADLAWRRNLFVAALADAVFIAHAAPGGKTAQLAATVCAWGKPLYTLESPDNANLVALGARPIDPHALPVH
jgi:predicted Rossmann fold nucleotide-binding protein DprA/Smf involved in DNA uptake